MEYRKENPMNLCFPAFRGESIHKHIRWDTIVPERLDIYNTVIISRDPDGNIFVKVEEYEEGKGK